MSTYFRSTCHPWASLLFLFPLIAAYEGGVYWLGGEQADRLRNGADSWLRWQLEVFGVGHVLAAPAVVIGILLLRSCWRWADRPTDPVRVWFGMALESGLFAFLLWQFSQNFGPLVDRLGVKVEITLQTGRTAQILTYIGAGIYEEVLFRLGLFSAIALVLRVVLLPRILAIPLAAVAGAVLFSAAHHLVPNGEPMNPYVFAFRVIAGLYFTALYVGRGFGVAVGAHAGYDILVGVTA